MDQAFYQDGRTARQYDCSLSLDADNLNIFVKVEEIGLVVWKLSSIRHCHLNSGRLVVKYGDFPQQTLECAGDMARQIYQRWSSTSPLRKAEGILVTRKNTAVIALCAFFLLAAVLLYFVLLPWAGEKAASLIPHDVEVELGRSLSDRLLSEGSPQARADSLANAFARGLDLATDYPLRIHVLSSQEINAFAVPGGNIFIYSGIIDKMNSYEELVALLGHEVSHVQKRHSLKSICRSAASAFFIAAMFGDISGISAGIISQADQFRQLQYSRELETEADLEGLRLMRRNRVDGRGMVNLLELLERESLRMPKLMKYLSTHPETGERISNVKTNIRPGETTLDARLRDIFAALKLELGAVESGSKVKRQQTLVVPAH